MPMLPGNYGTIDKEVKRGFSFEWSINFGTVISLVAILGSILLVYNNIITKMADMQIKVDLMWQTFHIVIK